MPHESTVPNKIFRTDPPKVFTQSVVLYFYFDMKRHILRFFSLTFYFLCRTSPVWPMTAKASGDHPSPADVSPPQFMASDYGQCQVRQTQTNSTPHHPRPAHAEEQPNAAWDRKAHSPAQGHPSPWPSIQPSTDNSPVCSLAHHSVSTQCIFKPSPEPTPQPHAQPTGKPPAQSPSQISANPPVHTR